jgi:hypothetical protein
MATPQVDQIPVKYQDTDGAWRVKIVAYRNYFTDEQKEIFLNELADHGRIAFAAGKANTTSSKVSKERQTDPDFDDAVRMALETYRDRVIAHHQELLFKGTVKANYDRNGNLVSEETIFPIRLIELELKKVDEGYRDKREVDVKVNGGVMVAPPDVANIDDWESRFSGQTIDATAKDITPPVIIDDEAQDDGEDEDKQDLSSDHSA